MVVAATMSILTVASRPADNHLAVLGVLAPVCAIVGRRARRHRLPEWQRVHIPGMGLSYIFLLTAFAHPGRQFQIGR
jgi:hypothetical protein